MVTSWGCSGRCGAPRPASSLCATHGKLHNELHTSGTGSKHKVACHATPADDNFDIDDLARRLSSEASRMRQSSTDEGDSEPQTPLGGKPGPTQPEAARPAYEKVSYEDVETIAGPANVLAQDFIIFKRLGSMALQRLHADLSGSAEDELVCRTRVHADLSGSAEDELVCRTRVNVFAATFKTGRPFQGPVTVLLKEFVCGSRDVGLNELSLLVSFQALPESSECWRAASADMSTGALVPAIGWFLSPPTEPQDENDSPDSLWIVYKFEGLTPLQAYPSAPQQRPPRGVQFLQRSTDVPFRRRCKMLRVIMRDSLLAVAALHAKNVVHGSLGSGSIMVNTLDDTRADRLVLKLDNLGFGTRVVGGMDAANTQLDSGKRRDKEALAVTLCEIIFGSLEDSTAQSPPASVAFQRLLCDVHNKDVARFRDYCSGIDEWAESCSFLDDVDGGGWDLLDALLQGDSDCYDLAESPFLDLDPLL